MRLGLVLVGLMVAAGLAGPALLPLDPVAQDLPLRLAGPSWAHPLGLDELGRDILQEVYSRVLPALGQKPGFIQGTQDGAEWLFNKTSGAVRNASKAVRDLFRKKDAEK